MVVEVLSQIDDTKLNFLYWSDLGGVAEWLKATVLKTVLASASVGSNPTPSAMRKASLSPNSPFLGLDIT